MLVTLVSQHDVTYKKNNCGAVELLNAYIKLHNH